jgi:hypothetical protein
MRRWSNYGWWLVVASVALIVALATLADCSGIRFSADASFTGEVM